MARRFLLIILVLSLVVWLGCDASGTQAEVEEFINEAFRARAEAVFKYKDKASLEEFYAPKAMEQSKGFLNWSPNGNWENVKDIKYSYSIRIKDLKVDGKQATALVYETAVITWDYIDPQKVTGTEFVKEDAWANRCHELVLELDADGKWIIEQDILRGL